MLKRLMLPSFLLLLASCVGAQEKGDRVYEFRFVPRKDAFFVPYGENRAGKGDWVTVRVRIAALHGNFSPVIGESAAFPAGAVVHSVEADQSNADMKAYAKSDLLYAVKKGVARSKEAVALTFYHMLSKVEVALKSGDGNPELTGAVVTIVGTKLKADFTPDKTADMAGQSARAGMITLTGTSNEAAPIKIKTVTTGNFDSNSDYGEAVVLPKQTISQNAPFIQLKLANGAVFSYKIPNAGGLTLESGKKYTYKITVNQSGLSVTSTIEDWTSEEKTGNAEMD